jgi:ferritin-like metal-binding protein YciE
MDSLHDLFVMELKDTYDAEHQIVKAMPRMIEATSSPAVKAKFEQHLKVTREQIERLHQVFKKLDMEPEREHCDGMAGILKDGEKILEMKGDPATLDAALISAAQKVEHYEISAYGTLATFAHTMGHHEIAQLLETTLGEEKNTDKMLSEVAERSINKKAA